MRSTFALAFFVLTSLSPALAAPNTREIQRRYCEADAMRLCKDLVPDEKKIIACMYAKQTQLSPECYRVFKASARPKS
ncbi:MAG: hypothetical protein JO163_09120 [Methylobacteriaceae bacterium]|nr:hypothetical protein [Methylobacteriaceae bacterium]MBV9702877.1 hypothetical protein [Methylobacteriaceae bacterium]